MQKSQKIFLMPTLLISCLMLLGVLVFNFVYREFYLENFYQNFISNIKWGDEEHYILAYSGLYPLVNKRDMGAINLISESYLYGYGIEQDPIKANIWNQRSQCQCFDTGTETYSVYQKYIQEKNNSKAQEFLLLAAQDGNKNAISHLKDHLYLEANSLNISEEEDKQYWKEFECKKLYPYIDQLKSS